ncbi:hypothetical protein ACIOJD_23575 [Streptomyces sp. NPDC088116]|uniref:hypothetical protein n=1 Tax=Streptomyces sp. NPDC088116 TaxID=3365825 RepID=UPI003808EC81
MTDQQTERWALSARLALAKQGVDHHTADPLLADVKARCAESGHSAEELFGSPAEFADATVAEQPADAVRKQDTQGMTPGAYLSGAPFAVTLVALVGVLLYCLLTWTLSITVTPASLTGSVLVGICLITLYGLPDALRASGRPRLAPWAFGLVAVLVLLAAVAFTELPRTHLTTVPVFAIVAVAVCVLAFQLRKSKPPRPSGPANDPADADEWLDRLTGVLIGRYDLPPERARALAGEAGDHLAIAATTPTEEFGPLDQYAENLAEYEPVRQPPWWRGKVADIVIAAFGAVLGLVAFQYWLNDGHVWAAYLLALPFTLARIARVALKIRRLTR